MFRGAWTLRLRRFYGALEASVRVARRLQAEVEALASASTGGRWGAAERSARWPTNHPGGRGGSACRLPARAGAQCIEQRSAVCRPPEVGDRDQFVSGVEQRAGLALPGRQRDLLEQVAQFAGMPVAVRLDAFAAPAQ